MSSLVPCTASQFRCNAFDSRFCVNYEDFTGCPALQADPDIAGIGVVVAFTVSAGLAWVSTLGHVVLEQPNKQFRTNAIDEVFEQRVCLAVRNRVGVRRARVLAASFYAVTVALSDQQLVTGIAMLAAGLTLLARRAISVYHFSVVRDLAFFSSNAHLLSLLALWRSTRRERSERKPDRHHHNRRASKFPVSWVWKWRFLCMLVFFALLMAATWQTAGAAWDDMYDCPAACVPRAVGGSPLAWAVGTSYLLVSLYTLYLAQIGEKVFGRHARVDALLNGPPPKSPSVPYRVVRSAALALRFWIYADVTELLVMLLWFGLNCWWAFANRAAGQALMGAGEWRRENQWGFGQLVPMLLLMLPAMAFLEAYTGTSGPAVEKQAIAMRVSANSLGRC
ncbi:hypothetical protein BDV95DRAFT_48875 [Massariosphaeria phaeospora]|uniref:Uncharacterized protein n=1 Tax=Massariosphaeria phaeospora TaxID=100035 RepID=A0A7C8MAF6_9PLEO|nr:hypothetical protein BDV95DRAFT_48875 [Massariosphaeria phaeospora]